MAFLVLEEESFSTAMLFNSAPAFFASSSVEENGTWTREWGGKGAACRGSSWNHLGSICSVHPPCPSISPLQQEQMRSPQPYRTLRHTQKEALKSQLSVHRKSFFSPLLQRWCVFDSGRPMGIASHIGSEIIRLTQLNLLKSKLYFLRAWLGSSVIQSCLILWPHGLQHTRLPCCLPTPRACSNSCPSCQWCHPTISSSVVPFSYYPQSFPASRSFLMSQFSALSGQSIGVSASASVLPVSIQDWFLLGLTGWISLQFKGLYKESSPTLQFKSINSSVLSFLYSPTLISIVDYW